MTILIHGFRSSGQSRKAKLFREFFKKNNIPYIAPSLSYVPELAMATLEELIESYDEVNLIASSLGGYYALYLAEKYGLKTVLINPSIYPKETLKRHLSKAKTQYDGSFFEWKVSHLEMLEEFMPRKVLDSEYLMLLQKGDEVIDYREAMAKVSHATMIVEEGGTHQFDGIEQHFEQIIEFLYKG